MIRQRMRVAGAPTPNDPKHGELSPASLPTSLAAPRTSVRTPFHEPCDANAERRRCAVCGERSDWRQLVDDEVAGGWFHCRRPQDISATEHADARHVCTPICVGLGGAA